VSVLIVRDYSGATADFILTVNDRKTIELSLQAILVKDAIFCSDGAAVYRSVAHSFGIARRPVNFFAGTRSLLAFTMSRTLIFTAADSNSG